MILEKLVATNSSEFPGFNLVGYSEFCIPMFKRVLHCSMVSKKRLAVVDEFVLRYHNAGLTRDETGELMGLPKDLIEQSWYNLVYMDIVDEFGKLTDKGREYLEMFELDNFEYVEFNVSINGLNGDIELFNSNLMSSKSLRESGLKSVKPLIEIPNIENIDIRRLKQALKKTKKNKEDENELVGLYHVEEKATNYKRLFLLIFADQDRNIRFMVFDGWQRMESYEDCLLALENTGSQVIKVNMGRYFENFNAHVLNELSEAFEALPMLNISALSSEWEQLIDGAKTKLSISMPLVDLCELSDVILNKIFKCVERGVSVEFLVTGREFSSNSPKKQYERLLKSKGIEVCNSPYFDSKSLVVDEAVAIVSDFKRTNIDLPRSKECYVEYGYKVVASTQVDFISDWIGQRKQCFLPIPADVSDDWVKQKMLNIIKLYYQFDEKLRLANGVGWLGDESIPDVQKLVGFELVKNEIQFKDQINTINKSLVETVESVWTRNGLKHYFWNDFKTQYPRLQRVLHKIKLYRHSTHHLSLEERYKPSFYAFLDEDLNGSMPMFAENGFQRIQLAILGSLEMELMKLV